MPEFRYEYNEISIVDDTRFHKLLCFIKYHIRNNILTIERIEGKLSVEDAKRNNWLKSIPFYNSFPNWLDENLPYNLTITFYTDISCATPVVFQNERPTYNELITLISDYQNSKTDAFFVFQVNS